MTYEMLQDIACEVINEATFDDEIKLFDLDPVDYFDEYRVSDGYMECAMPLGEFLAEYTSKLLSVLDKINI